MFRDAITHRMQALENTSAMKLGQTRRRRCWLWDAEPKGAREQNMGWVSPLSSRLKSLATDTNRP